MNNNKTRGYETGSTIYGDHEPLEQYGTKTKFHLRTQEEDFIYKPNERQFSFYQICSFSVNNRHKVRKIIYNENGDILRHRETMLKKEILAKFLKKCPEHKYTLYCTYDFQTVDFPDPGEIAIIKSHILNEAFMA
jgi:hypothetical protein